MRTSLLNLSKNFAKFLFLSIFILNIDSNAQYLPDILYYKFENNPTTSSIINFANPGAGTYPASITSHTLTNGGMYDTCLTGTGTSSAGINTGWLTNFGTGSWTISMWLNNLPSNTTLYYMFGEVTGSFRAFIGGVAGAGNLILRGTGITDVLITGVSPGPTVVHFVYNATDSTIRAYKNGTLANTVVQAAKLNLATGTGFKVGGYSSSAGLYGKMDEFRVYRKALSATDIANSWNVSVFPEYYNLNTGSSSNAFPFAQTGGKAVNSLIRAGEINKPSSVPSGQFIKTVHFRMSTAGTRTYTNLQILMAQCSDTSLTSGVFYSGLYDTVYFRSSITLTSFVDGWMSINLDNPYFYDPSQSLVLFVGQCGSSGTGGNVRNTTLTGTGFRRVWSVGGCPFVAYTSGDASIINFGVDVETASPMSGTYYVGINQVYPNFKTLTKAVYNLNCRGVSGPVNLVLTDASYSSEILPITINQISGASSINKITIKPNSGVTPIISGSSSTSIIMLNGADFVTIDGSNSGGTDKSLTIQNTNATTGTAGIWLASLGVGLGASNNTIKNCNISCNYNTGTSYGICLSGTTISSAGLDNDTVTIQNNTISKAYYGIKAVASSPGEINSLLITGNTIGSNDSTDYITYTGIIGAYLSNPIIIGNEIFNLKYNGNKYGLYFNIYINDAVISKNKIHGFNHTNTTNYYCIGIYFSGPSGCTNNLLDNNLIYDLQNYGSTSDFYFCGIRIVGGSGYKLYYNSISMTGAFRNTASGLYSKCLYVSSASTNLDIRNNIFYNAMTGISPKTYTIDIVASSTFTNCNYNDYYTTGSVLGRYAGVEVANLSAWKIATSQDTFSVSANPGFVGESDLSINTNSVNCWSINGGAYPISTITSDFSGNPRSSSLNTGPADIGAYEFTPIVSAPNLTVTGLPPSDGNNSTILFAGNTLAIITWHTGSGTLPSSISAIFQPQINPPNPTGNFAKENLQIIATGGSGYTYDIVYYYNLARLFTITTESDIRLAKYDASIGWEQYTTTPNATLKNITVTDINTQFSSFSLGDNTNPLPVQLKSFSSKVNNRNVILNWLTEKEINNKGFNIERKEENGVWEKIGYVEGSGNTNKPINYSYDDKKLNAGKYNYRLKQIDLNGNFTYYTLNNIVEIALPKEFKLSQNYPNPFNPTTKIDFELPFDSKVRIVIYDMLGREVKILVNSETKQAGFYTVDLNATNLSSGTYFYRMIANSQGKDYIFTKKMVIVK